MARLALEVVVRPVKSQQQLEEFKSVTAAYLGAGASAAVWVMQASS